jgi:hypothetical protein
MRAASFTAVQLLDAGCTLHALRGGGYSLQQLRLCGFSASDLVRECNSSTVELRAAGYSAADCMASGITVSDMSCYTTLSGRVVRCGAPSAPQSIHSIICTGMAATRCPSCCLRMSAPHKRCTPASRCRSCGLQGECCLARLPLLGCTVRLSIMHTLTSELQLRHTRRAARVRLRHALDAASAVHANRAARIRSGGR